MRKLLLLLIAAAGLLSAQPLQFVDRYSSTLSSGCTSPCTSLSVASASGLPTGATYFFATVRADGANTLEIFLVTNVSGTTLTVTGGQAGTSASNHGNGAQIAASFMTKGAFTQMEQDVQSVSIANASSTGTTVNKLAKLTGAPSTAVITSTSDTGGAIGIVVAGAGTSGSALVQFAGTASCVFDGATTAGDYVQISSGTNGDCTDAGATKPTSGQLIGRVLSTNGSGGTYAMLIFPPENSPGGGVTSVGGQTGAVPGGWILQEQHTASNSANLAFTTCISSSYDNYAVTMVNLLPATDLTNINLNFSTNGGSSYDTGTNYTTAGFRSSATGTAVAGGTSKTLIGLDAGGGIKNVAADGGLNGTFYLFGPGLGATVHTRFTENAGTYDGSGSPDVTITGAASYVASAAVNAFRIIAASGNITSGTVRCYGIAKQ